MDFEIIDFCAASEEELFRVVKDNIKTANMMESEVKKLRSMTKIKHTKKTKSYKTNPNIAKDQKEEKQKIEINQDFEDEFNYYYDEIKKISSMDCSREHIEENLPQKSNYDYASILLRIKAELLRNIKEIHELLMTEKENLTKEDWLEFREEITLNEQKIQLITEIEKSKEKECSQEEQKRNHLILVPTSGGNIRVIEELKRIDSAYYEGFLGLFQSIIDGSFKNVKRFDHNHSQLYGISEVKDFKIRVIFDRIGPHDYAILTAFIKKTDKDKSYVEKLINTVMQYKNQKERLKTQLEQEEFIKLNEQYQEELFNILLPNTKKESNKGGNIL